MQRRAVTAPGAFYTGLAIATKASGNFLFAADNANDNVDMPIATSNLSSRLPTLCFGGPQPERWFAAMKRILVIEDDGAVRRVLKRLFEAEGHSVDLAPTGTLGLELFRKTAPSAVVLDLRLPGVSGQEVCRQITQAAPEVPIIVLSATSDVLDKVLLLEMGAHDYVTKPFSPRELLARVQAALRYSTQVNAGGTFAFGDVSVSFSKIEVKRGGQPVSLTPHEFKTLKFMMRNADRVISREELLSEVWGYQNYPATRTVDNHILHLRQKLEKDPAYPMHFRTVHRAGYKFVP